MAAVHKDRVERLERIIRLLPLKGRAEDCPDPGTLLLRLAHDYEHHTTSRARLRAIQRDLTDLVKDGLIKIVNPGGKPLRYCRASAADEIDPYLSDYTRKLTLALIQAALPTRRFEGLWKHVLDADQGLGLGDDKFRVVSDTQRLLPADIHAEVLATVLEALATSRTLNAGYRDGEGKRTRPVLHPQALLQRGPRLYLYALKNDELEPVRMYALHRMTSCSLGDGELRVAQGFDLQQAIDGGSADFGDGREIHVVLRARGYVADLLHDCPLSASQRIEDEEQDASFAVRVQADVPATGQLLRWLLGCGDNVEVVEPQELRRVVAVQAANAAGLYRDDTGGFTSDSRP
jgi:proteasome accessory factor B